ncbi:uncharacterized protein LOC144109942 [Amblyomma americanum]
MPWSMQHGLCHSLCSVWRCHIHQIAEAVAAVQKWRPLPVFASIMPGRARAGFCGLCLQRRAEKKGHLKEQHRVNTCGPSRLPAEAVAAVQKWRPLPVFAPIMPGRAHAGFCGLCSRDAPRKRAT